MWKLFAFTALMSALLACTIAFFLVRGFWVEDIVSRNDWLVDSSRGSLLFQRFVYDSDAIQRLEQQPFQYSSGRPPGDMQFWEAFGLGFRGWSWHGIQFGNVDAGFMTDDVPHTVHRIIILPLWMVLVTSGILPVTWCLTCFGQHRRRKRRRELGLCPRCGYDVRTSPERCSECGFEIAGRAAGRNEKMDTLLKKPPSTESLADESNYLDCYRIIRGQIEHEDNLVGSRISWFVTSQSFLFSAYAIMASSFPANATDAFRDSKHTLLLIIPMIAIATSVLILLAIFSGIQAMAQLRRAYAKYAPRIIDILPPIHGDRSTRITGMAAPVLLPPLFMAVWLFLLFRRLF